MRLSCQPFPSVVYQSKEALNFQITVLIAFVISWILAFVLIGGNRNLWGPVVGGALLTAIPELLRGLADWRLVINGLVLVVASLYLPRGIVGALQKLGRARAPQRPTPLPEVKG